MQDVIIVGGSYAAMAAALQLLRARRSVLIVDAGQRRNRFASHSHGFLGQDGVDPAAIWANSRAQVMKYPTVTWLDRTAVELTGSIDDFTLHVEGGAAHQARRVLLATGVSDSLPEVPGMAERWGQNIFHCPYCHGYELNLGQIGVIATGANSIHQAQLLPEWGPTTFLLNGATTLDAAQRADLAARGVTIEETPIREITGAADVVLTDGRVLSFAGLFTAPKANVNGGPALLAGAATEETPFGIQIRTDQGKATNIPGLFACGDGARVPHSLSLAVADGAWAGANIHRSLVFS
ncbi:NAD(P)/FAD-dependent oxidoreductase [Ketogulonicigenium vulgare]|uniref:NAD(P)/FAD-dependent oxidoreductase n=1 Tax=Ketogulonicigenium vulgare TaxID=92945 RepID=UPI002359AAB6|nr:NAD(P)/FAD-dependent oxidoreductase [Ketogulonicigenium vulgare]